jgi:hypothetical protein
LDEYACAGVGVEGVLPDLLAEARERLDHRHPKR